MKNYLIVKSKAEALADLTDTVSQLIDDGYTVNGAPVILGDELVQSMVLVPKVKPAKTKE